MEEGGADCDVTASDVLLVAPCVSVSVFAMRNRWKSGDWSCEGGRWRLRRELGLAGVDDDTTLDRAGAEAGAVEPSSSSTTLL